MIKELSLKNFKCYANQTIDFKKINLLTGTNSSGKSTIIQSLKLFSMKANSQSTIDLRFKKDWDFIGFNELLKNDANSESFEIGIDGENKVYSEFFFQRVPKNNYASVKSNKKGKNKLNLIFVRADRFLSTTRQKEGGWIESGYVPESGNPFFADYLYSNSQSLADDDLTTTISKLMVEIGLIKTDIKINKKYDSYQILVDNVEIDHVGTGIKYTLPLLLTLISNRDSTICIENPELHLHPSAQVNLVKVINKLAYEMDNQIVMETHSDHVINTLRVLVKNSDLAMTDLSILFLKSVARIETLSIDSDGRMSKSLDGFFDQYEKQLLELL